MAARTLRKIRSQPPDVVVAVGTGECMQEFECYKIALSFASPYFDAMFSAGMSESNEGRIEFLDRDPEEWKLFYGFVDPARLGGGEARPIDERNATILTKWFHEFQMDNYLRECDDVLFKNVQSLAKVQASDSQYSGAFWHEHAEGNKRERITNFAKIIELLHLACIYDLNETKVKAEHFIDYLILSIEETHDLFDIPNIKALVYLSLPLEMDEGGKFQPQGKSTVFWDAFILNIHLGFHTLSGDTVNNLEMLSLLLHSYLQNMAKDVELHKIKKSAKVVGSQLVKYLPHVVRNIGVASSECLEKIIYDCSKTHEGHFRKLGIAVHSSYDNRTTVAKGVILAYFEKNPYPTSKSLIIQLFKRLGFIIDDGEIDAALGLLLEEKRISRFGSENEDPNYDFVR